MGGKDVLGTFEEQYYYYWMPSAISKRETIFISHATPGDNPFATWLASRLAMAGYSVWCDQEKLLGGEDFWKNIEAVIRGEAIKFVLVMSHHAFNDENEIRDGIAKEIALADIMKKKLKLENFIIPMRIDDVDYSDFAIDFIRLNGIDCSENWADGFSKLLKALDRDNVPNSPAKISPSLARWRNIHTHHARAISNNDEPIQTNWLSVLSFPEYLNFYEILRSVKSTEPRLIASECELPCENQMRFLVSFAEHEELQEVLGDTIPIKLRKSVKTIDFLHNQMGDFLSIAPKDARRKLSSLTRQAIHKYFAKRGLAEYEMASGGLAWWFKPDLVEDDTLKYTDFNGKKRRRAVIGRSGKKENDAGEEVVRYYWHLGFTAKPIISDDSVIILKPRIIVTEDKENPLASKVRLNSARRSITKMWFNDKWRGMVRGFSQWLAEDSDEISISVGSGHNIILEKNPLQFTSPVSIGTDPVSETLSDEIAEADERQEINFKLTDPAFRNDDEGGSDDA